jgi:hypothetical protein
MNNSLVFRRPVVVAIAAVAIGTTLFAGSCRW